MRFVTSIGKLAFNFVKGVWRSGWDHTITHNSR